MDHPALTNFLRRLRRRSELNQEEKAAIISLPSHVQHVRSNHDIIHPSRETDEATLVVSGLAGRFDPIRDGRRQITAVYIKGDMCDLYSVVSPIAGWGLMALSDLTILKVPHAELRRLAVVYPAIAFAFWRDTTADASILSKWVGTLGRRRSVSRLAHLLCEMGIRLEAAGLGERRRFNLEMTQQQLAEAVGITAIHVNRSLQQMRGEGLIRSVGRDIEIPNWDALCDLAEFDPAYLLLDRAPVERWAQSAATAT